MNKTDQLELVNSINEKCVSILESKGHDYAGEDVLLNFKQLHSILQILKIDMSKVEGVHMFYILIKLQRICNLLFNSKSPKNESIQDTILDFRNYLDLLNCAIQEKQVEKFFKDLKV